MFLYKTKQFMFVFIIVVMVSAIVITIVIVITSNVTRLGIVLQNLIYTLFYILEYIG